MFKRLAVVAVVVCAALPVAAPASAEDTVGLVNPVTGEWLLRHDGFIDRLFFGDPGDYPFLGDWDCDGVDTPGLYRQTDGFVYLSNSLRSQPADIRFFFGDPGDLPLAGDWNGDGCDTVSIYRPAEGRIYVIDELGSDQRGLGAADRSYLFGDVGDEPFVGDFDGDGVDTVGLHRESTGLVYFRNAQTSGPADHSYLFGDPGDMLAAGDWDGAGFDKPMVFRPTNVKVYFRFSNTQGTAEGFDCFHFGWREGLLVSGDIGKEPTIVPGKRCDMDTTIVP